MELGKINTNFPVQVHVHGQPSSSSELSSSSPQPISYSTGRTSPGLATNNNKCPSLVSDIDSPTPSDHSLGSSPPTLGNTSPAAAIASSPHSNSISPSIHQLNSAIRWCQPDQSKMNPSQVDAIRDRPSQAPGMPPYTPRSIESANWRAALERANLSIPAASSLSMATMDYHPPYAHTPPPTASQYQHPQLGWPVPHPDLSTFPCTPVTSFQGGTGSTGPTASARRVDAGQITNQQFYGYGYDRGGGKITLLVPVDVLPPMVGVPQTLTDRSGIVILPTPPRRGPGGLSSNPVSLTVRSTSNTQGGGDNVQHYAANFRRSRPQSQIDSIVASSSTAPPKRIKIYCDKWIHEGVCAFQQQGCKYKHEMPMDKATQYDLGLFQGLPSWWKKHQAELQRQHRQDETSDAPICLTRSRETSPRSQGSRWERRDITGSFTPPQSAVSASNSSSPSPVPMANGSSNRLGHQTMPRRLDTVHGLGASRHNEAATTQKWPVLSELGNISNQSRSYKML
ncbi:hypothetical protein V8F06_006774 [Rhypophila decipiens]